MPGMPGVVPTPDGTSDRRPARQGLTHGGSRLRACLAVLLVAGAATAGPGHVAAAQHAAADVPHGSDGRAAQRIASVTPPPINSARDLLLLLGMDESLLAQLRDGQPISDEDSGAVERMLLALRQFQLRHMERWHRAAAELPAALRDPEKARCEIFPLRGVVTWVEPIEPLPEVAALLEMPRYYRCDVELEMPGGEVLPAQVYTERIAAAWPRRTAMRERTGAWGFFLKLGASGDSGAPRPIFAARHLAWYPRTLLGDAGLDFALFDQLAPSGALEHEDRECFYQTLAVLQRVDLPALQRLAEASRARLLAGVRLPPNAEMQHLVGELVHGRKAFPGQLLAPRAAPSAPGFGPADVVLRGACGALRRLGEVAPYKFAGTVLTLEGTAWRILRVPVDDADIQARYGIDHYYEMEVFVQGRFKLGREFSAYPVVFCVRELPPGIPTGERVNVDVRVSGVFLKVWSYQSRIGEREGGLQPVPLLVGRQPIWLVPQDDTLFAAGWVAAGLLLVALGLAWVGLWRWARSDRQIAQRLAQRNVPQLDAAVLEPPAPSPDDAPGSARSG
jgi:hypothetical protein